MELTRYEMRMLGELHHFNQAFIRACAGQNEASSSAGDRHPREGKRIERLLSPDDRQTRGERDTEREAPKRARGDAEKRTRTKPRKQFR